ncbi:MAG: Type IV secretory pathway, VirB6 components [Glomeribacter sp. 1016415]|uniref:TrbL/VirB6 plasmid conjugal transfer protein n=1 Tax=Mycoavidus cysteinexigens TaxID=1553431 RepID=A0A2Z6EVQ9_9BURK|nr:type IV secretion system protein [Mycoavidus cysteinexigens]MCX8566931.1 Type IV secretory pathway, VirB6 components [Glomeribacter sp. 1016415]BBE09511.1 TrbL/VirB6 plasmid conjugal transfer protein [Mycoavidus cysteinexigens]GAM51728.1 hypothetical protein EBME_0191 [bacterium endosymbiont of Mortierella elongata FMR23-6]GLR01333.1 hypothetical protein GCM10007934_11450 [Mycoavidus cysteinexigens]
MNANDPLGIVNELFQLMQKVGLELYGKFISEGIELLLVLGLVMTTWHTLMWMLADTTIDYFVNQLNLLVKVAILLLMLTAWTDTVRDFFIGNMERTAQQISANSAAPVDTVRTLWSAAQTIFSLTRADASSICEELPKLADDDAQLAGNQRICHLGHGANKKNSWFDTLSNLSFVLLSFIFKVIAVLAIAQMAVAFMLVAQMSSFLLAIGFCLGPILLPWYIFPATEFLFNGWLRFIIVAGLYKVIAWLMLTIVQAGINPAMQKFVVQLGAGVGPYVSSQLDFHCLTMLGLAFTSSVGAYMMWQVPQIAQGIVSGHGALNFQGFGPSRMAGPLPPNHRR